MARLSSSLDGRVIKLERQCARLAEGASFFMIWGKDDADMASELREAKKRGELKPRERFDARIWTHDSTPPAPRWTRLDEMRCEELGIIAGGEDRKEQYPRLSIAYQWSDVDLSNFYTNSLRVA